MTYEEAIIRTTIGDIRGRLATVRNGDDRVKLIIDGDVYSVCLRDISCRTGIYDTGEVVITAEVLPSSVGRTVKKTITTNPDTYDPIEKVIFNDPATIVIWKDGSKTVVKVQEWDTYDPEKGLAMAIAKKFFGNKGNYCDKLKKWTDKYYKDIETEITVNIDLETLRKALRL